MLSSSKIKISNYMSLGDACGHGYGEESAVNVNECN
jgi:hypothetical protein